MGHTHLRNPSRIVVARFGHLGDGVLATAVLVPLREAWPEASIDVVCYSSASSVFMAHPSVRRVFSSPLFDAESPFELVKAFSWRDFCDARNFLHRTDLLLLLNHIVSPGGYLKYLLLLGLSGGATAVGLDTDRRGSFLDIKVPDAGLLVTHEVEHFRMVLRSIGIDRSLDSFHVQVGYGQKEIQHAEFLLTRLSGRPFAVFHSGSALKGWRVYKRLDPSLWVELGLWVWRTYNMAVVLVGTSSDAEGNREIASRLTRETGGFRARGIEGESSWAPEILEGSAGSPDVLDITGETTVSQLAALIEKASLFIGTDSGVAHVAATTSTPGITLFTFSDWIGYAPWSKRMRIFTTHADRVPCLYWQGYRNCTDRACFEVPSEILTEKIGKLLTEAGR